MSCILLEILIKSSHLVLTEASLKEIGIPIAARTAFSWYSMFTRTATAPALVIIVKGKKKIQFSLTDYGTNIASLSAICTTAPRSAAVGLVRLLESDRQEDLLSARTSWAAVL